MVVKGKPLTIKEQWQRLKRELKDMTPKERLEHLWEYYKGVLVIFAIVVFSVAVTVSAIISMGQELRLGGAMINVTMSADGYVMLQNGYFERIGGQKGKDLVELHNMQFRNPYTTTDQTYALDVHESVVSMISGKVLDYVMFDDVALEFFLDPEMLMDLRQMFSEETVAGLGGAVIWVQIEETGEMIPLAVNIQDTAFYREHIESDQPVYLAFAVNTPRKDTCLDFWQYIKGGQTDTLQTVLSGAALDVTLEESTQALLTSGLFDALDCRVGDHRIDLTPQSQEMGDTLDHVKKGLEIGTLDYVLCTADGLDALQGAEFSDLRQILPQQALTELEDGLVYQDGVPVAVIAPIPQTHSSAKLVYLAFSANTQRQDACKALWGLLSK